MGTRRQSYLTALGLLAVVSFAPLAQAQRHVALVVGNNAYASLPKLDKAVADAKSYADLLGSQGFEDVTLKTDLTKAGLDEAMATFLDKIKPGDTALFAYSGHGWSDGAQNYILGTDAPKSGSQELLTRISIPLRNGSTGVLDDMDRRGAALKVAIIDACRDNPFQIANGRGVGVTRGLTRVDPPRGTFVVFSAGTGQTALDALSNGDKDPNSVFTRVFVPLLRSGLTLQQATKEAQGKVVALARTIAHDQQPAYYDEVLGEACLSGRCLANVAPPLAVTPAADPRLAEAGQVWATTQGSTSIDVLRAFQQQYAGTPFANLAGARVTELQRLAALPPPNQLVPNTAPAPNRTQGPQTACTGGVVASVGNAGVAAAAQRCLRPKDTFRDCADICPEMVVIPAGSFTMGSPATEKEHSDDEGPTRSVMIPSAFAVGKFAVTADEWNACVSGGGCGNRQLTGTRPATNVSWDEAKSYVTWLSRTTGRTYRLLTESEREYVARAGTATPFWWGSSISPSQANYNGNAAPYAGGGQKGEYRGQTLPVDSFAANPFGPYNVHGNVFEWTEDCYHDSYSGAPGNGAAWTAGECQYRVIRGGSWSADPKDLRSAFRSFFAPSQRAGSVGLRVARALTP